MSTAAADTPSRVGKHAPRRLAHEVSEAMDSLNEDLRRHLEEWARRRGAVSELCVHCGAEVDDERHELTNCRACGQRLNAGFLDPEGLALKLTPKGMVYGSLIAPLKAMDPAQRIALHSALQRAADATPHGEASEILWPLGEVLHWLGFTWKRRDEGKG